MKARPIFFSYNFTLSFVDNIYLWAGEFVIDDLQLDSKFEIVFANPSYKTVLHVNNRIAWNGDIQNTDLARINAKGFKLYYYGTDVFYVYGLWRGTIIAPNAKLVLGQNQYKRIFGQFLAYQLVVHQYSSIRMQKFSPKEITRNSVYQDIVYKKE